MNATIQCLKSVPELREALSGFKEGKKYNMWNGTEVNKWIFPDSIIKIYVPISQIYELLIIQISINCCTHFG